MLHLFRQCKWGSGNRDTIYVTDMFNEDLDHPHLNCLTGFVALPGNQEDIICLNSEYCMSVCHNTDTINQGSGNAKTCMSVCHDMGAINQGLGNA